MNEKIAQEKKSFLLRIDSGLLAELNQWAAQELRSANSQIEYILKDAVRKRKKTGGQEGSAR